MTARASVLVKLMGRNAIGRYLDHKYSARPTLTLVLEPRCDCGDGLARVSSPSEDSKGLWR